jgi:UDP-2-acetamido-3-amino-2,3-dideoxy-glucuronate N-acetyltransferase
MPDRPNVYVHPSSYVDEPCEIGEGTKIWHFSHVMRDARIFTNVINPRSEIERKHEFRTTRVGRGATLGANCTILCGHDVGTFAFIGAGAVVTRGAEPYALMVGTPARRVGWMCRGGVRLGQPGPDVSCASCGRAYREAGGRLESAGE